jgi:hypothetical protein
MGVHKSPSIETYWRNRPEAEPIHTPLSYMSLRRFQQIKCYLYISSTADRDMYEPTTEEEEYCLDPEYEGRIWWDKVEPLASVFRNAYQRYYISSEASIDEFMIRCFGRSEHTYKMPNKPIK